MIARWISFLQRSATVALLVLFFAPACLSAVGLPEIGEPVRLTRGATLLHDGKKLAQAGKGQEFTLLQRDAGSVSLAFMKEDGSVVAAKLPADAIEAVPPAAWEDLMRGMRAFRDQRHEAARLLLARAARDKEQQALATALMGRVIGAMNAAAQAANPAPASRQALVNTIAVLRETAEQLAMAGRITLAAAIDEGAERLAAPALGAALPPSKIDRAGLSARAAVAEKSFIRARQSVGARRLIEGRRLIEEGLVAEPSHPGLKAFQPGVKRGLDDAEELYETANKMKRFEKGALHALSAIDDGLKLCADHPRLRALRGEMSAQFEERTSPLVDPAFLATAKVKTGREHLEEGRRLYTIRCAECHDLEMLDSRSLGGWDKAVSGMAGRANLMSTDKARIMEYLAAALVVVETAAP